MTLTFTNSCYPWVIDHFYYISITQIMLLFNTFCGFIH